MQIAICNMLTGGIIEQVSANSEQEGINSYIEKLAEEYGLDTPNEFIRTYPLIAMQLRGIAIH